MRRAVTLMELVIAMAMIGIIFASVLPQFAIINNSWDAKQGIAEALQNGRVLIDHINRNLSKAVRITAVSDFSVTNGYIQFISDVNDSNTYRYDIGANNYIEYGRIGDLADLAGPVSLLKFTCYDACDLDTPVTDGNLIRTVKVDATITNSASMGQNKTFTTWAYLRTNGNVVAPTNTQTTYDYASRTQGTNIFAYQGESTFPTDSATPSSVLSSGEYDNIESDNGSFHMFAASSNGKYALMRFVIVIDESESTVASIVVTWNGKGINGKDGKEDGATLYIWNYAGLTYQQLQKSANTEAEVVLTGTVSSQVPNYIGGAGQNTITLLVASNEQRTSGKINELYTDYIKVEVSAQSSAGIYP